MRNECEGCAEYEVEANSQNCSFAILNKYRNICPCSFCLIKSMCNTACEAYKIFEEDMQKRGLIYEE